ncbi:CYTH domain-containing protein [Aquabacter spiritensis]|uniref:CYTH domain-containing protein n=1 Tax=Aquabacter spiritensis TaxID=933073 RepID=A0A4V2UYN5_9HYPH|nr:CYTH domain-containing protein [Aquabacter spiritensis]TCT08108.1 CYTH domain-containing protein [Aquabacter spiritensis]
MPVEIERKYLVTSDAWREDMAGTPYRQGYMCVSELATVRVRQAGERAFLTIKGATAGLSRAEFEYEIPVPDAEIMLRDHCTKPLIEKTRYEVPFGGKIWTVDVFDAANAGLIVAEVELTHADEQVQIPPWAGREVTDDPRYRNSSLISDPMNGSDQ